MTLNEAKETKRWWLQNEYKYKGQGTPPEVMEAMRILEGGVITDQILQPIRVIPPDPEKIVVRQTTSFSELNIEGMQPAELVEEVPPHPSTPKPKGGYKGPVVQDDFTERLIQLSQERMTATPERAKEIDAERQSIYSKRTARKNRPASEPSKPNPTKNPQAFPLPTVKAIVKPTKPAPKMRKLSEASPQESTEIKQLVAELADQTTIHTLPPAPPRLLELKSWLEELKYRHWKFLLGQMENSCFLQVAFEAPEGLQKGRKWYLSDYATKSEVIQTAFKAVLTAEEHETREAFRYKGQAIFAPHYNVEALVAMAMLAHTPITDARQHLDQ